MAQTIRSVAIRGGFMGAGIAESASIAEFDADTGITRLHRWARTRLEKSMEGAVKRGKLDAGHTTRPGQINPPAS